MIFLDSSFIVSVEVKTDQNHKEAIKIRDRIINNEFGEAVISDYVFGEIVTINLQKTKDLKKTVLIGEGLKNSVKIIAIGEEIFNLVWDIFKKQEKTKFSFTDCSIIAIMKSEGIKNIATFDKDFKKVKGINIVI